MSYYSSTAWMTKSKTHDKFEFPTLRKGLPDVASCNTMDYWDALSPPSSFNTMDYWDATHLYTEAS